MKWSIGKKIGGVYSLALVMIIFVGMLGYQSINTLQENEFWVKRTYEILKELEMIVSNVKDANTGERGYVLTGNESYLEPYLSGSAQVYDNIQKINELTAHNPVAQRKIEEIKNLVDKQLALLKNVVEVRKEKGFEAAREIVMSGEIKSSMDNIRKAVDELEIEETQLLDLRSENAAASVKNAVLAMLVSIIVAVLLMSLAGFFITRNITVPLDQVVSISKQIASGDLPGNFTDKGRGDEIGILLEAFSNMTRYLKEKVGLAEQIAAGDLRVDVKVSSERDILGNALSSMVENLQKQTHKLTEGISTLASSASEISASVAELASGTAETATSISETSTTMEEVKQTSQMANKKAKYVSDTAQQTEQISKDGKKATDETIEGMNDIREKMESIGESIMRLSEQSQAIGEIIATVNDLADQSNLLAVNAAIEAAKAGEQGKGFTVVAQEIKNLAEQSKKATSQVQGILSEIQKATGVAVMVAEQGAKAVEKGVKQSAQAGESILALSNSVAESAQAAMQIAAASQQQMVGIDQAATAMENIKQASSQNSIGTKQLETAALTIAGLGQELKQLTERYKI